MRARRRCGDPKVLRRSRSRGAASGDRGAGHCNATPVCQVASEPDSGLARTRQAEEGRESPTADGRKRDSSPTASCRYYLRSSRTRTSTREASGGPGVRPATSPTKGKATKTGSRRDAPRGDRRTHAHMHAQLICYWWTSCKGGGFE